MSTNPRWFVAAFVTLFLGSASMSFSQQQSRDILYLKNGSVIKGTIMELVPDKTVKIQTADGSIFIFPFAEVEKLTKEELPIPTGLSREQAQADSSLERKHVSLGLSIGISLPVGSFGATSGEKAGYAKLGLLVGAEIDFPFAEHVGFLISGNYSSNSVDEYALLTSFGALGLSVSSTPWTQLTLAGGLRISTYLQSGLDVFVAGQLGAMFGSSAGLTLSGPGGSVNQGSSTARAFTYGFSVGIITSSNFKAAVRYFAGTPKYNIVAAGGGVSISGNVEQPTSHLMIVTGIGF